MNHYTHFTLKEREILKHFIDIGKNQTEISILLGKNKSSISREIKRNSQNGEYIPCEAHDRYKNRRFNCKPRKKLDNPSLYECVKNLFLRHQWSPEQISVNDTLRMYKNDDIRMYNFNCITDTIVEVITTCNTYTLLTVHLL